MIIIPDISLILLIGLPGSGRSVFAERHFSSTEVLSADLLRAMVGDHIQSPGVTRDAHDVLHLLAEKRMRLGRTVVVDASNLQADARRPLLDLAKKYHYQTIAVVCDTAAKRPLERNLFRALKREGIRKVHVLKSDQEVSESRTKREPMWVNRSEEKGPFDLIGDVHGCNLELQLLLTKLGYKFESDERGYADAMARHPAGRRVIFLGDLVDRGPNSPACLRLAMNMVKAGTALMVPGNHEERLKRYLKGYQPNINHGLQETIDQLALESDDFGQEVLQFIESLVSHMVLDGGALVAAHAGMTEERQGRGSPAVRDFALYGETTGEIDQYGLPVHHNWAESYRGQSLVVFGHTPVPKTEWRNNTLCVDTGCVFGGKLSALRYPELIVVDVPALRTYCQSVKPLNEEPTIVPYGQVELLPNGCDISARIKTKFRTIRAPGAVDIQKAMALISQHCVDPRCLIYLPPTMSPAEASDKDGLLEHPEQALEYYRRRGVQQVICEEKHMGSRAVVIVGRHHGAMASRFGLAKDSDGVIYTKSGRPFFQDQEWERGLLHKLRGALEQSGLWDELATDWLCLDTEIMPWSFKALSLLKKQYAAAGAAATMTLSACSEAIAKAGGHDALHLRVNERLVHVERYRQAYRPYAWEVSSIEDLRVAPFHILAGEQGIYTDRTHLWHMQTIARIAAAEPSVLTANYLVHSLDQPTDLVSKWWESLHLAGGEGMVVKPIDFIALHGKQLLQPALKVRGPDYLNLIYGPEYRIANNLHRLRERKLSLKRGFALDEFVLGLEGLERFVRKEPFSKVHQITLAILALKGFASDPRL